MTENMQTKTNSELMEMLQQEIKAKEIEILEEIKRVQENKISYQGMTIREALDKYQIHLVGDETWAQLRKLNSDVGNHMEEVQGFISELEAQRGELLSTLTGLEEQMHQKIISVNIYRSPKFRLSDDVREHLAKQPYSIGGSMQILAKYAVEIGFWRGILRRLDNISKRIVDNQISITSESKAFGNGSNDNPTSRERAAAAAHAAVNAPEPVVTSDPQEIEENAF